MLERLEKDDSSRRLVLVTGHRRESFGQDLANICTALRLIAERNPDVEVVYPVHLNPNVSEPVRQLLHGAQRVHLLEPLGYAPFVWLMKKSYLVLTDSGGIQEEAPSLGKPTLVMRKKTERPEGIEAGAATLVGVETESIVSETQHLLDDADAYARMANVRNPYGDGAGIDAHCRHTDRLALRPWLTCAWTPIIGAPSGFGSTLSAFEMPSGNSPEGPLRRIRSRWAYYRRVFSAYVLGGTSQLTFWYDTPLVNEEAPVGHLGQYYMPFLEKASYSRAI